MENETDVAREYLKKHMGCVYHDYIDKRLAGDFAYTLANKITALETKLKAAEEKLANSVPFEVFCRNCGHCKDMRNPYCYHPKGKTRTPENCPMIPKVKTDE